MAPHIGRKFLANVATCGSIAAACDTALKKVRKLTAKVAHTMTFAYTK